ncbi:MAG TPA: glycine cleavage system aminomethyltransferase GcvT [Phenylobacterium sp.]|uniref:glycine cleavage system aminomethyltransferase GcvT n=1 Tax=Phenylobacterium sp. TaxID=1871053 RepID=UPI002C649A02|nr:glycine cleavage system aminomethyltransferase GcvT [Phenylobacterium sp.]HSV04436.1 glycine cleavage system aminomethyltransferase GcvT [Phenylobacterium sp.]
MPDIPAETVLRTTPLTEAHLALGARMVPFAGYTMPVQYAGEQGGVLREHLWTREHAGAFDVSHMGQARLTGPDVLAAFEALTPGDFQGLEPGRQKYSLLLNRQGGIVDDLMAGRPDDEGLFLVVNGACKDNDFRVMGEALAGRAAIERLEDRALIALQGPKAAAVLARHAPQAAAMVFMDIRGIEAFGTEAIVSRSGYTGEDGYELSVPAEAAVHVWNTLMADERVRPVGLGARDSLRLEAGLPLYGHDLDETVSPVEAGLAFAVSKPRRRRADFPGAERILGEFAHGCARFRVGLKVLEGAPAREGAEVADEAGRPIGVVTSGGFSPSLRQGIALAFVPPLFTDPGTRLKVVVRGKPQAAEVAPLPFVAHRYVRTL